MSERRLAAERVAAIINEAEQAMDLALSRASILLTELPHLQQQAGVNGAWAQPAVTSLCTALAGMTAARGSLIDAHRSLSAVQRKLGVTVAEVPLNEKPAGGVKGFLAADDADRVVRLRA